MGVLLFGSRLTLFSAQPLAGLPGGQHDVLPLFGKVKRNDDFTCTVVGSQNGQLVLPAR